LRFAAFLHVSAVAALTHTAGMNGSNGTTATPLFRGQALRKLAGPDFGSTLLAAPPRFTVFATAIALVALALIALLIFGRYTQRATVSGYVTVTNGDVRVFPQAAGTVEALLVREGDLVTAGTPLFILLTSRNDGLSTDSNRQLLREILSEKSALESRSQFQLERHSVEFRSLQQSLQAAESSRSALGRQQQLSAQKFAVVQRNLERARRLHRAGHLSARDLDALEIEALDIALAGETIRMRIAEVVGQVKKIQSQLIQIEIQRGTHEAEIAESASRLEQRLVVARAGLEQSVVAPVDGRVSALHVTRGQTVLPDTLVLSLLPITARFHAELFVPGRNIGMLDGSPRVQLRFDAFPFEKYGLYGARIDRIAGSLLLPGDARLPVPVIEPVYRVRAVLDQQHVAVNGKQRRLAAGLTFKADILVSERSLLEWMLAPVIGMGQRL
jgi:membrane fusion protein